MNRRRMMMLQQKKGFELVYDAASGLLPTECGWKKIRDESNAPLKVVNGILEVVAKTPLYLSPDTEQSFTNCSLEVEYSISAMQGVSLTMNKVAPSVTLSMSPYANNGIMVFQQWEKPLIRNEAIKIGVDYTAKLEKQGNLVLAFFNGELIYNGELTGHYSQYLYDFVNVDPNGYNSPIYIKKMVYRGY
ncbi:MAG: hypothetical protein IKK09_01705 [Clostridia bacterium]|nr:hypothetical protein [Clostridia bacterium]